MSLGLHHSLMEECANMLVYNSSPLRSLPGRYTEKRHNLLSKLEVWASQ